MSKVVPGCKIFTTGLWEWESQPICVGVCVSVCVCVCTRGLLPDWFTMTFWHSLSGYYGDDPWPWHFLFQKCTQCVCVCVCKHSSYTLLKDHKLRLLVHYQLLSCLTQGLVTTISWLLTPRRLKYRGVCDGVFMCKYVKKVTWSVQKEGSCDQPVIHKSVCVRTD